MTALRTERIQLLIDSLNADNRPAFIMTSWFESNDIDTGDLIEMLNVLRDDGHCGTQACLAGQAVFLGLERGEIASDYANDDDIGIYETALKWLDLTYDEWAEGSAVDNETMNLLFHTAHRENDVSEAVAKLEVILEYGVTPQAIEILREIVAGIR